tara:strand:+ start:23732 stop:25462 length:1731 start_codon:yes stop_codon:yes gene_type:complete
MFKADKMNLLNLTFLISISFIGSSFAQTYDQSFLDSLPEDIQASLIERNLEQRQLEETQYRRPSTFISKPDPESNRFGLDIFSMMQSTLMPLNEPNIDDDYILDFGDVIEIQLVGQRSQNYSLTIKRDGSINLPDVGKIFLSGLSLGKAADLIKERIKDIYIGVDPYVTLTNIRDIQVIIAGNVFNPGPYTLNGNSNVFHALMVSGGPSEAGSFRNINLVRNGQIVQMIDLYQTFIFGKPSFGERLRTGDIIFVNPASKVITVSGAVKRPGVYELNQNETFEDLINFANGITVFADQENIRLDRFSGGEIKSSIIDDKSLNSIEPLDQDILSLRSFPQREVQINGYVLNPGTYRIREGETLSQLVKRAGGYIENAYEFGGVLTKNSAYEANLLAREKLIMSITTTATNVRIESNMDQIDSLLSQLEQMPLSSRVVTEFDLESIEANPSLDIILDDGDTVLIPSKVNQVYIFGEVQNQGGVSFKKNQGIDYYIDAVGGLNDFADKKSIFLLHPNGISEAVSKNAFISSKTNNIYEGTIIFIPRDVSGSILNTDVAIAYSSIIGNIGLSLASLASIKD